jgi:hypothetical protein
VPADTMTELTSGRVNALVQRPGVVLERQRPGQEFRRRREKLIQRPQRAAQSPEKREQDPDISTASAAYLPAASSRVRIGIMRPRS